MTGGVTDEGFVTQLLPENLQALRDEAILQFQDLVAPGDTVDVSDSAALGRLIGLIVPSITTLWEMGQQVYSAFDPNTATGVALDNIVQYGALTRKSASYTTAYGLFSGDKNTLIPAGNTVRSSTTGNSFTTTDSVALSTTLATGVTIVTLTVADSTLYTISYTTTSTTNTVSYTSGVGATMSSILSGLASVITSSHPLLTATVSGSTLIVDRADVFQNSTFSTSANLNITKVKKIGSLQAVVIGVIEQEANTIDTISTPVLGWDSITNPIAASPGQLEETDEDLRIRFRNTKLERSTNILDSLYSALLNLEGVTEVAIYENDTDVTDSNGVLPHSFLPVVLGGSSQLIADTIWENKPMGIRSQGNTIISVTDSQNFPHDIGFEIPSPVTVYVEIDISVNPESSSPFPGDGADQIKQAIIDYAASNFGVGDDVIYSRLYTPINTIPGHQVNSLFIGTTPSPVGVSNIVVPFNEISSFESVNINVTVT